MERNNKKDYSIEDIEQKIKELKGFEGHEYSKEDIEQIIEELKKTREISEKSLEISLDMENIKQKIKDREEHEYSKEEIMEMTKSKPAIYGCSIENIKQKIKDREEHEYSKEEIIKILEQQKYIAEQEKEISELARGKDEHE